ncbi:translation Initiation factor eIF-4e [Rhodotorula toruloides]|uniref:Translation Initiation factor eIF-4e n=1 Tax=Rhodotorula toruloides TaxID=5286 RepID=A0A511K9S6_RHOTO|nr:translation Initiation factor eIF-4e [Rhodotorula toruloides]
MASVADLVKHHSEQIRRASPQPPSPTLSRKTLAPTSPSPQPAQLPDMSNSEQNTTTATHREEATAAEGAGEPQQPQTQALGDIQEADKSGEESALEEGEIQETAEEKEAKLQQDKGEAGDAPSSSSTPASAPTSDSPLAKILEALPTLPERIQESIRTNLERVAGYPRELPLSASWTLHFSDTSGTKSNSPAVTKEAYTEGIIPLFTCTTVPSLCGQLKAFKSAASSRQSRNGLKRTRVLPGDANVGEDGFGLTRAGQNLHFFRTGISPTWEDPYNEKGGRLTISPSPVTFDSIYERLILLLAGSSLEIQTSHILRTEGPSPNSKRNPSAPPADLPEGMVMGVVASRRARGDRIEVWVGGKGKKEPAPMEWVDRFKEVLGDELGLAELKTSRYKKHLS